MLPVKAGSHNKSFGANYQVFHDRFSNQSASTSGSAVFTSYFAIFCGETHNKYDAYLFRTFLAEKTASWKCGCLK